MLEDCDGDNRVSDWLRYLILLKVSFHRIIKTQSFQILKQSVRWITFLYITYVHITSESFWNFLFHLCCTGIFWLNSSFAPFRRTDCERLHEKLFYLLSQKVLLTQWHTLFGFLSSFYVASWFFFGVVSSYFFLLTSPFFAPFRFIGLR